MNNNFSCLLKYLKIKLYFIDATLNCPFCNSKCTFQFPYPSLQLINPEYKFFWKVYATQDFIFYSKVHITIV